MSCQEVITVSCPCILADINECRYCSLLQGEEVCNCSWQGHCVYEWYQADRNHAPAYAPGTIAAVITHPKVLGLIVQMPEFPDTPTPGSQVKITLPAKGNYSLSGVVLRQLPLTNLYYVVVFDRLACNQLSGQIAKVSLGGNAILGWQTLFSARDQAIAILASQTLLDPLQQLAAELIRQGNHVTIGRLDDTRYQAADILLIAGSEAEIKIATTKLPQEFVGKIVVWQLPSLLNRL